MSPLYGTEPIECPRLSKEIYLPLIRPQLPRSERRIMVSQGDGGGEVGDACRLPAHHRDLVATGLGREGVSSLPSRHRDSARPHRGHTPFTVPQVVPVSSGP